MRLTTALLAIALAAPTLPSYAAEKDPAYCAALRKQLKQIDSAARHRSTPQLTAERKRVKDQLHAYSCSEID